LSGWSGVRVENVPKKDRWMDKEVVVYAQASLNLCKTRFNLKPITSLST
jgi:hypothetical protein